jgi:DNA-directed RNA polymerase subunit RPC12/RpoP
MKMGKCMAKHTKYQPTDEEWKCPKCGSDNEHFYIEGFTEGSDDDCDLLHDKDEIGCDNCGHGISGKLFASRLQRKHNLITCPHCKGKGLIKDISKKD